MIGLIAGYIRWLDGIIMRIMDGLMAIPAILLAIGLISVFRAGLLAVIIAIVVPEVPRVVRLVRSIVLSIREEPYVESAVTVGTPTPQLIVRHVLPNTIAPLIVQGTFICAAAILLEAILSFLGIGIPPEDQERIFDEFTRIGSGSSGSGVGLGLSIVESFVQLHGGSVRVEDAGERGARFVCRFPIDRKAARAA